MATSKLKEFEEWLSGRLIELNTDEAVIGPYIQSLLEDNDDLGEQEEVVESLLCELMGSAAATCLRNEIFAKWRNVNGSVVLPSVQPLTPVSGLDKGGLSASSEESTTKSESNTNISLDSQLDQMLRIASQSIEEQASSRFVSGKSSKSQVCLGQPDSQLRAKILSQMGAESQSDSDEDEPGSSKKKSTESSLPNDVGRHANVSKVLNEQKEMKDKAKAAAAQKREKDKDDRIKQKAQAQEKKDKAKKKAAKVERKR